MRLVRLIRIVKLYKATSNEKKEDDDVDQVLQKYLERKKKVYPSGRGTQFGGNPGDQSVIVDQSRVEGGNNNSVNLGPSNQIQNQIKQEDSGKIS